MGGSLRSPSTSLTALWVAVEGAAEAGADTRVIDLKRLGLPFYTSEHGIPPSARRLADTVEAADALLWSSPTYHGSVSGAFKNAVDWLALLADHDPPLVMAPSSPGRRREPRSPGAAGTSHGGTRHR
ncbi:NADPH-dependent FMN reductase [Streptomyces canus]|uniref:NADPH-dependent FMN reductase n=1 Tax=Streptomyces canus TaxID=58343 RepID=UPI0036928010